MNNNGALASQTAEHHLFQNFDRPARAKAGALFRPP